MAHRTLHLPCCSLRRIGFDTRSDRSVIAPAGSRLAGGIHTRAHSLREGALSEIAVAL